MRWCLKPSAHYKTEARHLCTFNDNFLFKGIVHQFFLILSWFIHPRVVQNLYEFLSSVEHERRYFEKTKTDILKSVANDFHCIFVHTMEVNGYRQLFVYQHFSKYLSGLNYYLYFHPKKRVRCTYCVHIVLQNTSAATEVGYGWG